MNHLKSGYIKFIIVGAACVVSALFAQRVYSAGFLFFVYEVRDGGHIDYTPYLYEHLGGKPQTFHVLKSQPILDISHVVGMATSYDADTRMYSLGIEIGLDGRVKVRKLSERDPNQLIGVFVNNKFCQLMALRAFDKGGLIKTVGVFDKKDADNMVQNFLQMEEQDEKFRNLAVLMGAAGVFLISSGLVVVALHVLRTKNIKKRQQRIATVAKRKFEMREKDELEQKRLEEEERIRRSVKGFQSEYHQASGEDPDPESEKSKESDPPKDESPPG